MNQDEQSEVIERRRLIAAEEAAVTEFVSEYVMSTEGADYEPKGFERELIDDALRGWLEQRDELLAKHGWSRPSLSTPSEGVIERAAEALRVSAQAFRLLEEVAVAQLEHDKARNFIRLGDKCRESLARLSPLPLVEENQ